MTRVVPGDRCRSAGLLKRHNPWEGDTLPGSKPKQDNVVGQGIRSFFWKDKLANRSTLQARSLLHNARRLAGIGSHGPRWPTVSANVDLSVASSSKDLKGVDRPRHDFHVIGTSGTTSIDNELQRSKASWVSCVLVRHGY